MFKVLLTALIFAAGLSLDFSTAMATPSGSRLELQGEARKREIRRKVNILADMSFGLRVHEMKPGKTEDLILALAAENYGASVEEYEKENAFHRMLPSNEINFGDMIGWGTMNISSASDLFATDDNVEDTEHIVKSKRRGSFGQILLMELSKMSGVGFGFTDGSSGYCGVSFMGLLIVDEENGLVYEFALTSSGPC